MRNIFLRRTHHGQAVQFLTDFFDQAVVIPLAVSVGIALAAGGWRRGALAWAATACMCWTIMLALKLGFDAFGPPPGGGALTSPSGHTAAGTVVYAGLLVLWAGRLPGLIGAVVLAAIIGSSRLALGAHSLPDVLVGGAVGVGSVIALSFAAGARPKMAVPGWAAALVAAPLLLHGAHLGAEGSIQALARCGAWPPALCLN